MNSVASRYILKFAKSLSLRGKNTVPARPKPDLASDYYVAEQSGPKFDLGWTEHRKIMLPLVTPKKVLLDKERFGYVALDLFDLDVIVKDKFHLILGRFFWNRRLRTFAVESFAVESFAVQHGDAAPTLPGILN